MEAMSILPDDIEEVQRNDGDYIGDDGLLRCGKCNAKKQTKIPASILTGGEEKVVRCICKCQAEEERKRKEQEEQIKAMERIKRIRNGSLIDERLKTANLSTFQINSSNEKVYILAKKYVEHFDKMYEKQQGILFFGPVGTGKSYTAACIVNELLGKMVPAVMTSFVKIMQNIQGNQDEESAFMNRLNDAKLLVIDDLGAERNTDYALEKVYNIIDSRYRTGKPLILTTNMTVKEMQETTDIRYKRIYDRIFEMCFPVKVSGKSWREKEAADRFDSMRKLMEG